MHRRAEGLVWRNWDVIDDVAGRLIRDKTLSERQVLRVLRERRWGGPSTARVF